MNISDLKVLLTAFVAFIISIIDFSEISPFRIAQWVLVIGSLLYTARRWYLMEKNNKNKNKKQ